MTPSFAANALSTASNIATPKNLITTSANSVSANIAASVASILGKLQLALSQFIGATTTDQQHLSGLSALSGSIQARDGSSTNPVYMGAVSPWFFTHYGPDSFNKNVGVLILVNYFLLTMIIISLLTCLTNTSTPSAGRL